jgi:hypothetical protein
MGGTTAVARALRVGTSTASEIKRRGRIPAEYWEELIAAAHRLGIVGVDADALVRIHSRGGGPSNASDVRRERETRPADFGHFTRFKHLRRDRFRTLQEINDHVAALREEWDRR